MKHIMILMLMLTCLSAQSQHAISGVITDKKTNQPLSDASVFLPDLHLGSYSDDHGSFDIRQLPSGKLLLEIAHLGYQSTFLYVEVPGDSIISVALDPSFFQMREVVVTGSKSQAPDKTIFNIAQITRQQISETGALSITDALSRVPGVSQLTTGAGISKPVIRGLYGNRIQVNVNGLRFDNQQWQDEHGLGLSDMGVERVEIIRGPASVLYGTDAMGGVLNIIEERPAHINSHVRDMDVRLHSNTLGLSVNYGSKRSQDNRWKKFRIGFDNHADYSDGNNNRVLNSRFSSYNLKASWGRNKSGSTHVFNVMASHSLFGFVFDSLSRKKSDPRVSRAFDGPHHMVSFVQAGSENTYFRSGKEIKLNGGVTSNLRLEDEGGGGISLSMLLNSLNGLVQVAQPVGAYGEWRYGGSLFLQSNTNFGGRIIIPDAISGEASAFSYYQYHRKKWLLESGVRYDKKLIETFATNTLNVVGNESPTQEVVPFTRFYDAFNFSLGANYELVTNLFLKVNASSGYRPGNLAELSSNGLHEGTLRWEIGMSDAKIEQNFNVEGSLNYSSPRVRTSLALYSNHFRNYIYLAPDGTEYYGFDVYHFRQSGATLRGGELSTEVGIPDLNSEWSASYSFIDAEKSNGENLPFIPANKITAEVKFHIPSFQRMNNMTIKAGASYAFDQDHPAEFETPTDEYFLVHAGLFTRWKKYDLSLIANNLLNENYYDHLSRFKYYGIANMGRSIVLGLKFDF